MSDNETSPAVQKAVAHFHKRVKELDAQKAMKEAFDDDLGERVRNVVEERDRLFHIASEMIATLLMERNEPYVNPELRMIAKAWLPQIEAIGAGRELSPEELSLALEASGVDIGKGLERIKAAIEKYKANKAAIDKYRAKGGSDGH